jgi:hypothetical protein
MSKGETPSHLALKERARDWARANGYRACGIEIRIPSSPYRADVAGYKPSGDKLGITAIFECKQARGDFLRDAASVAVTQEKLKLLHHRRLELEKLLKVHYPNLRRGETLFAEYDVFDLEATGHVSYTKLLREIAVLQSRLYGKTKLDKLTRYQCANLLYFVSEPGIVAPHEVPLGWGWLERHEDQLTLNARPTWQEASDRNRLKLLEAIAIAGGRSRRRSTDESGPDDTSSQNGP